MSEKSDKTWKELSDEATPENIGKALTSLNEEDQVRFMKRALTRNPALSKSHYCVLWLKRMSSDITKYKHLTTDESLVEDLPGRTKDFYVLLRNNETETENWIKVSAISHQDAVNRIQTYADYKNERDTVQQCLDHPPIVR